MNETPTILGYSFNDLYLLDTINLEIIPEKKGIIVKHIEYELTSLKYKTRVKRRYRDFDAFHEILQNKYPYRIIPVLPPKSFMNNSKDFIEQRRKSLKRFLQLITRHPILSSSEIVKYFLTYDGSDACDKLKDNFSKSADEYMINPVASIAKDNLPMDVQNHISISKQHISMLHTSFTKIKELVESVVQNHLANASLMVSLGKELNTISNDALNITSWECGNCNTWNVLKTGLRPISVEFTQLQEKFESIALQEDELVLEQLTYFIELLNGYKELCSRHEKGIIHDHSKSLQKMRALKTKHMSARVKTPDDNIVDQLESRIVEQENEILNLENRNYFSLLCLQLETQLIHSNMDILLHSLNSLFSTECKSHSEVGEIWKSLVPKVEELLSNNSNNNNPSALNRNISFNIK